MKKMIFWLVCLLWVCAPLHIQADGVPQNSREEFQYFFDLIRKNRIEYNAYNDSIYLIHDHNRWVNFFKRRSIKIHHIHDANAQIFKAVKEKILMYGDTIPPETYRFIIETFKEKFVSSDVADPFSIDLACNLLDRCGKSLPDSLKGTNLINLWRLDSYIQMRNLVNDAGYMEKAYQCLKNILSDEARRYPYYDYVYAHAMEYVAKTYWMVCGLQSIDEFRANCRLLNEFLDKEHPVSVLPDDLKETLIRIRETEDEALVRNTYLVDSTTMGKQEADSLMNLVVKRNLSKPQLTPLSHVRTLYMQMMLDQITPTEAREQSWRCYKKIWKSIRNQRFDAKQLNDYLQPFYTFFYMNYKADISERKKRRTVLRMCRDMERVFMNRRDQQKSTDFVRDMNGIMTYNRVAMYLKPKQLLRLFTNLNVATQVTTHAHSVHVAAIADVLVKAVLKYQPELLTNMFGLYTVDDVLRHKQFLRKYAHDASLYHDAGKSAIVSVVNNEFRPLTDEEYHILKFHPTLAMKYFDLIPELKKFHDTTLGHHKWYNGKGGYPDSFDNTKSPVRFMIDIVTLSDCLQAATEKIARNYRYGKKLETVMEELKAGAGTRYNPDLVSVIENHPDVAMELNRLIEDGWPEIYYKIYRNYFFHGDSMVRFLK